MKTTVGLVLLALLGFGLAYWGWKRPLPEPKTVTQYLDRTETKTVYRETTKPDGTVVKETAQAKTDLKSSKTTVAAKAPLSRWKLGASVSVLPEKLIDPNPVYGVQGGYRVFSEAPIWMTFGVDQKKRVTLGVIYEW